MIPSLPARLALAITLPLPLGCSAGGKTSDASGASSSHGGSGSAAYGGNGQNGPSGGPGDPILTNPGAGGGSGVGATKCAGVEQRAEVVTEIIYEPISIFIMQDRSSSMVGVWGDPSRWPNSTNAVNAFVTDPSSGGISVGAGFFPPVGTDGQTQQDCAAGSDCGRAIAPIAPLPGNAQAVQQAYQQATPPPPQGPMGLSGQVNLTPTECAVRGMLNTCLQSWSGTGQKCVAVLVTDGEPTTCTVPAAGVFEPFVGIVADGAARGVPTFAVALPGAGNGLPLLQQIAQAGGTQLIDLTAGGGSQEEILKALNTIRSSVTQSVQKQIDCQWVIPPPENGEPFDRTKVNVKYTPPAGAAMSFGAVASAADCARTADGNGWYYDNPAAPTQVLVCPNTCNVIKAQTGASLSLEFGCDTIPAIY